MKKVLFRLLPLILAGYGIYHLYHLDRYSWRQKLTVTVETPAGEVSGSSVSEVSWGKVWPKFEGTGWDTDLSGEAVVVEVTPGRYLFALLRGTQAATGYMEAIAATAISGDETQAFNAELFDEIQEQRDRAAGVIPVPEDQYPMMVTFKDFADPASVKLVDPANLAASFGPGVRLKAVTLEVTDEAVTDGLVLEKLGWMVNVWPNKLDGQRFETIEATNRLANSLGVGSFSTIVSSKVTK